MNRPMQAFTARDLTDDTDEFLLENSTTGLALGSVIAALRAGAALTVVRAHRTRLTAHIGPIAKAMVLAKPRRLRCSFSPQTQQSDSLTQRTSFRGSAAW